MIFGRIPDENNHIILLKHFVTLTKQIHHL